MKQLDRTERIDIFDAIRQARKTGHNHNCECPKCAPFCAENGVVYDEVPKEEL